MDESEDLIQKLLRETLKNLDEHSSRDRMPELSILKLTPGTRGPGPLNLKSLNDELLTVTYLENGFFRLNLLGLVIDFPRNFGVFSDIYESFEWPGYKKVYTLEDFDEDRVLYNLIRENRPNLENIYLLQNEGQLKLLLVESETRQASILFLNHFLNSNERQAS